MGLARQRRRFARLHAVLLGACKPLTPEDAAFYPVQFETSGDYPHHDVLYALARGRDVKRWADSQGCIDGDSWDPSGVRDSVQRWW